MAKPKPITKQDFAEAMAALDLSPVDGPFAVAVSGGPDSMALALLFADWAKAEFLTFDHKLRPESAAEAKQVGAWLKKRGLKHHVLAWEGGKPKSNIQAEARNKRYQALKSWCRERGVRHLVLAHTLDDQAETFLIRLFRGSGVDGLAAMAPKSGSEPTLVRPLLGFRKQQLISYIKEEKQDWIEDPSNENLDFTRIKVRKLLEETDIDGFDAQTLAATASRMSRTRNVLDGLTGVLLQDVAVIRDQGFVVANLARLFAAPEEIGLRALARILMFVSQNEYPPRLDGLERLHGALAKGDFKGATLHGCQLIPGKAGKIFVCREAADISDETSIEPDQAILWDGRFRIALEEGPGKLRVRVLGESDWQKFAGKHPEIKDIDLPFAVKTASPALFHKGKIVAIPQLDFFADEVKASLDYCPSRGLFPLNF